MLDIKTKLESLLPKENIKCNEPMSKHTTFKTGGIAEYYITAKTEEQVIKVRDFAKKNNIPLYIIGNGSNLLVNDKGVKGIILKIGIDKIKIDKEKDNIYVTVGAGTKIMNLGVKLKNESITGFEELSGIPGTIGGANRMNAGAYGKEMKDIIIETKCIDKKGNINILSNEEQKLGYRTSIFQDNNYIILELKLKLKNGKKQEIEEKMKQYETERKEKQPYEYPSAGSTFKRGDGYITAQLIDECGLKGYSIGGAQISEKHAGFVINKGNATSEDILNLIQYTKKKVFEKFKIEIAEEIEII